MSRSRTVAGVFSAFALAGMAMWSISPGSIRGPARVEAAREFRITAAGDGRVRWSVLDGTPPGGPVLHSDGVLQGERGDALGVSRDPLLIEGSAVALGQPVAWIQGTRTAEDAAALAAEVAALAAEEALLAEGGRPETIALARQQVAVAQAALEMSQAEVTHLQGLVAQQAGSRWELEQAQSTVAVRKAELAMARAGTEEARLAPRQAELDALRARREALQARLTAASVRDRDRTLESPVQGVVALGGEDVVLAVREQSAPVLQIAVEESWQTRVAAGDLVIFTPTAGGGRVVSGRVMAVGDRAEAQGGRSIVWVAATLDEVVAVGATGTARIDTTVTASARL